MKLRHLQIIATGLVASVWVACSSDPEKDDCAEGERCPCTTTADCPNPLTERCDPFVGACISTGNGDTGTDADADVGADAPDADGPVPHDVRVVIGSEGACTNPDDLAKLTAASEDMGLAGACWIACQTSSDVWLCLEGCVADADLSDACETCYFGLLECLGPCQATCAGDNQSAECVGCYDACDATFDGCAGAWSMEFVQGRQQCTAGEIEDLEDTRSLLAESRQCTIDCQGVSRRSCSIDCVEDLTGTGESCATCFVFYADCVTEACGEVCSSDDEDACGACLTDSCLDSVSDCVGASIVTDAERDNPTDGSGEPPDGSGSEGSGSEGSGSEGSGSEGSGSEGSGSEGSGSEGSGE